MSGCKYAVFSVNFAAMKAIIYLLFPLLSLSAAAQPGELKLKGSLKNTPPVRMVFISFRAGDQAVRDSVTVENGTYKYKRPLAEPVLASISFKSDSTLVTMEGRGSKDFVFPVFLEPGSIEINTRDSVKNYTVKGSQAHADYQKLVAAANVYDDQMKPLYHAYSTAARNKDIAGAKAAEHQIDSIDEVMRKDVYGRFVETNPSSPTALYALKQYAGYMIDPDKIEPYFNRLPKAVQDNGAGAAFRDELEIAKKTAVGRTALEFTMNDTLDRPVSLSSFRGQYVLVDFWASWCGPCRRENPNVVKAFNTYKDKKFTVLGVSLDRPNAKDRWMKAIHDDNLTWNHVSDLKFWDNAVAKLYGVRAIPQNLLIDPAGVIIARNLTGEELAKKLGEVLK
jgi:peroxiredoxin